MFAFGIFKVIYSPFKAFKEIMQNPKYTGPILIMILFMAANTGYLYLRASKTYYEQTLPKDTDEWTQNKSLWASNTVPNESNDSLSGGYYGNKSIEFSIVNDTKIWMQINFSEPIICSGTDGYKNVTFWIKAIYPNTTEIMNATLYLFSNQTSYFSHDLPKDSFPSNETLWNKLNIPLGPENGWVGVADWGNITSLKLEFIWSKNANLTMRLDGLFFRGIFKSALEIVGASTYPIYTLFSSTMQFFVTWVFIGGLTFIIAKGLGAKILWRASLIIIGFALITLFVQALINVATIATWPTLNVPLEFLGGIEGESQIAQNQLFEKITLSSQINQFAQIAMLVWTIALCTIAVRLLTEFSWNKSALVAVVAYFIGNMAVNLIMSM